MSYLVTYTYVFSVYFSSGLYWSGAVINQCAACISGKKGEACMQHAQGLMLLVIVLTPNTKGQETLTPDTGIGQDRARQRKTGLSAATLQDNVVWDIQSRALTCTTLMYQLNHPEPS